MPRPRSGLHLRRAVLVLSALPTLALLASGATADVRLPSVLSDHAVLPSGTPLVLWGWASPGEEVRVAFAGREAATRADDEGRWRVTLEALEAGGPHDLVVQAANRVVAADVLVGELWLASGQSNMEMVVGQAADADAERKAADLPRIRFFTVAHATSAGPREDVAGRWVVVSPESVGGCSAVAYYFGREVHRALDVPVGLVVASWGGTAAEPWTPEEAVAAEPGLTPVLGRWEKALREFDPAEAERRHRKALEKWRREAESDRRAGRPPPPEPQPEGDPRAAVGYPGALWRGMVAPLTSLAPRGVIWYQGESNAGRAGEYRILFPTLIRAWREAFGREDLPFYFVQLAAFGKVAPSGETSAWAELRDAQLHALRTVPRTGMAVAIDVGDANDIHPKDKQSVGKRLALWALADAYGRPEVVPSGPVVRSARSRGDRAVLEFDHRGGGLATTDGRPPLGFAVAGRSGKFEPARAAIEGETVVVWSPGIRRPLAVRYAWADVPEAATLVNAAGLPASPFHVAVDP